jgi:hypothetical protein
MMGGVNSRLLTQVPTLGWPFLRNSKNKTKQNKTKWVVLEASLI